MNKAPLTPDGYMGLTSPPPFTIFPPLNFPPELESVRCTISIPESLYGTLASYPPSPSFPQFTVSSFPICPFVPPGNASKRAGTSQRSPWVFRPEPVKTTPPHPPGIWFSCMPHRHRLLSQSRLLPIFRRFKAALLSNKRDIYTPDGELPNAS